MWKDCMKALDEKMKKKMTMNEQRGLIDQITTGDTHILFLTNKSNLYGARNNSFG